MAKMLSVWMMQIAGKDIKKLKLKCLRKHIGLVQQEPALFATTIYDNILYGKDGATEAEVVEAAKLANAHSFISSLPEGYKTKVGERGVQLSGGQKQRIAIARALAARPSLLVADEPISALDASTQTSVAGLMRDLVAEAGAGMLFISHDLAVVRRIADRTFVMFAGRVLESGRTDALWAQPQHPYTRALLAAIPEPDGAGRIPAAPSADERMLWSEVPPVLG